MSLMGHALNSTRGHPDQQNPVHPLCIILALTLYGTRSPHAPLCLQSSHPSPPTVVQDLGLDLGGRPRGEHGVGPGLLPLPLWSRPVQLLPWMLVVVVMVAEAMMLVVLHQAQGALLPCELWCG